MFNKKENEREHDGTEPARTEPAATFSPDVRIRKTSVIGPTLKFRGELSAKEDLIIEGEIEGTIAHHEKNLTVGKEGRVKADINARSVEVFGWVEGGHPQRGHRQTCAVVKRARQYFLFPNRHGRRGAIQRQYRHVTGKETQKRCRRVLQSQSPIRSRTARWNRQANGFVMDEERTSGARSLPSVIGATVVMKGDLVVGEDLVIEGTYDGTINARDTVTLRKSAQICGEVTAGRLQIEDGTKPEERGAVRVYHPGGPLTATRVH